MRRLEEIDSDKPVTLTGYRHALDRPLTVPVAPLSEISLVGEDAARFLAWASGPGWRPAFETDLQSIAQDGAGQPLLTTWIPLVTFRESFCAGGRMMQDEATQALMDRLRTDMRGWREAGADTVDISGYMKHQQPCRTVTLLSEPRIVTLAEFFGKTIADAHLNRDASNRTNYDESIRAMGLAAKALAFYFSEHGGGSLDSSIAEVRQLFEEGFSQSVGMRLGCELDATSKVNWSSPTAIDKALSNENLRIFEWAPQTYRVEH